jgi:hypothetical protein
MKASSTASLKTVANEQNAMTREVTSSRDGSVHIRWTHLALGSTNIFYHLS